MEPVLFFLSLRAPQLLFGCQVASPVAQNAQARTEGRKVLGAFGDLKCGQACAASATSEF